MGKTLEEIKEYCREKNSYGALLLTGIWGSGKTYFIKNIFCKDPYIASNYIPIIISLFGECSIENVHMQIKLAYLKEKYLWQDANPNKIKKFFSNISRAINTIDIVKKIIEPLCNLDILDLYEINDKNSQFKKIIIIFDDLERTELNIYDVVGIINDYCENKRLKVILVSNEAFLIGKFNEEYNDYKEKTIDRTIYFDENALILNDILVNYPSESKLYKEYLTNNKYKIISVLSGEHINFRRLKIAIHMFQRVYDILIEIDHHDELSCDWFIEFILYYIYIGKKEKSPQKVRDIPISLKKYISIGELNCDDLKYEIDCKWSKNFINVNPIFKEQYYFFNHERIIYEFYLDALEIFKKGKYSFSLNEYAIFIKNYSFIRNIKDNIPKPDFDLINDIILCKINNAINAGLAIKVYSLNFNHWTHSFQEITDDPLEGLTDSELEIYRILQDACCKEIQRYIINHFAFYNLWPCDFMYAFDHNLLTRIITMYSEISKSKMHSCMLDGKTYFENLIDDFYNDEILCISPFIDDEMEIQGNYYMIYEAFKNTWINHKCKVVNILLSLNNFIRLKSFLENLIVKDKKEKLLIRATISEIFINTIDEVIVDLENRKYSNSVQIKSSYFRRMLL
ncbi:KAP family NTPase [Holdemania massiliensis]|uniref:KAP family NTPase n=1 Tax=Holdemania massiliensis TaxID=1468449 RepID=UPI001F058428|nr:KAP family NTPase [Holdemania massiliensis]MCH1942418.1 KAP family NTPase [Holdemania massiliensis]